MKTNMMYTWDVVNVLRFRFSKDVDDMVRRTVFRCAKQEDAEYLRDWCEAELEDNARHTLELYKKGWLSYSHYQFKGEPTLDKVLERFRGMSKHEVEESEVILCL